MGCRRFSGVVFYVSGKCTWSIGISLGCVLYDSSNSSRNTVPNALEMTTVQR
jgi:hypothetical protein